MEIIGIICFGLSMVTLASAQSELIFHLSILKLWERLVTLTTQKWDDDPLKCHLHYLISPLSSSSITPGQCKCRRWSLCTLHYFGVLFQPQKQCSIEIIDFLQCKLLFPYKTSSLLTWQLQGMFRFHDIFPVKFSGNSLGAFLNKSLIKMPVDEWYCAFSKCIKLFTSYSHDLWKSFHWYTTVTSLQAPQCLQRFKQETSFKCKSSENIWLLAAFVCLPNVRNQTGTIEICSCIYRSLTDQSLHRF